MTGFFESSIEIRLDGFPDRKTIGFEYHTASYRRTIDEICSCNDFEIPFCIILCACRDAFAHIGIPYANEKFR
jgi:hypothetical protein